MREYIWRGFARGAEEETHALEVRLAAGGCAVCSLSHAHLGKLLRQALRIL